MRHRRYQKQHQQGEGNSQDFSERRKLHAQKLAISQVSDSRLSFTILLSLTSAKPPSTFLFISFAAKRLSILGVGKTVTLWLLHTDILCTIICASLRVAFRRLNNTLGWPYNFIPVRIRCLDQIPKGLS